LKVEGSVIDAHVADYLSNTLWKEIIFIQIQSNLLIMIHRQRDYFLSDIIKQLKEMENGYPPQSLDLSPDEEKSCRISAFQ
jgi:hypothetical protein